jgi:hypothetical protein
MKSLWITLSAYQFSMPWSTKHCDKVVRTNPDSHGNKNMIANETLLNRILHMCILFVSMLVSDILMISTCIHVNVPCIVCKYTILVDKFSHFHAYNEKVMSMKITEQLGYSQAILCALDVHLC